jgi:hypothetical protein
MTAFRDIASLEYTDVLEVLTASIIRVMGAVCTCETLVYSNETTRRYVAEGSHLHARRRENLKSHKNHGIFIVERN